MKEISDIRFLIIIIGLNSVLSILLLFLVNVGYFNLIEDETTFIPSESLISTQIESADYIFYGNILVTMAILMGISIYIQYKLKRKTSVIRDILILTIANIPLIWFYIGFVIIISILNIFHIKILHEIGFPGTVILYTSIYIFINAIIVKRVHSNKTSRYKSKEIFNLKF